MQKFSSDYSIINYVHSLQVISPGKGEEFDFSVSNDVAGVHIINYLYILEIISDCRSDPFTLIDLYLLENSYMIACTPIFIILLKKEKTVHLPFQWGTWNHCSKLLDMI